MSWRSWRRRRADYKLMFPLSRRRYRRYRKKRGLPDLPGIWRTPREFYGIAREYVTEHEDGWFGELGDPGHRFVAWEMAVRYEAACKEIQLHYTQLCDGPTEEEWQERIKRITACLGEMERLSRVERAARPLLLYRPDGVPLLAECPQPRFQEPPHKPRLEELAAEHLDDILPRLHRVIDLQKAQAPFRPEVVSLLRETDQLIPGAGMQHYVFLDPVRHCYPFDAEFEGVLRPLRYSLSELGSAYMNFTTARYAVYNAGSHLEGCVKALCEERHQHKPLGTLLSNVPTVRQILGDTMTDSMVSFARLAVNPAKHDYRNDRGPIPLFLFEDAVYAHFLARRFGAEALRAASKIDPLLAAIENATTQGHYFRGGHLTIP